MCEKDRPCEGEINSVSFSDAMEKTAKWQEMTNPNTGEPYPKSYTFSKVDFMEILNEINTRYVRIYPCVEEDGSINLLAVGADWRNADIIHKDSDASGIYNFATPCPNTCGKSPLNHDD